MKRSYDRLTATSETSVKVKRSEGKSFYWQNMMTGFRKIAQFLPNDVEMVLASYAEAAKAKRRQDTPKYSWQSYKGHKRTFGSGMDKVTVKYTKSNVIH